MFDAISTSLLVPANGRIVLGQTASSAGSATVHYVYGTGFSLPKDGTPLILSAQAGV